MDQNLDSVTRHCTSNRFFKSTLLNSILWHQELTLGSSFISTKTLLQTSLSSLSYSIAQLQNNWAVHLLLLLETMVRVSVFKMKLLGISLRYFLVAKSLTENHKDQYNTGRFEGDIVEMSCWLNNT